MAQALIGDGLLPHTMTDRSAMRINDVTVLPRTSARDERPRRPTSTVSTSRASTASSLSGSPCLRMVSTASPASLTRSCARRSSAPASDARRPRPCRSEEHTSELQSLAYLVCRLLLEKKKYTPYVHDDAIESTRP